MFKCKCGKWTNLGLLCSSCIGLDVDWSYDLPETPEVPESEGKKITEESEDDSV